MVETFFDRPVRNDVRPYENIRKLPLVKEMTTQLVVYYLYYKEK